VDSPVVLRDDGESRGNHQSDQNLGGGKIPSDLEMIIEGKAELLPRRKSSCFPSMNQENIAPERSFTPLAGTHPGSLASGEACWFLAFGGSSFSARPGLDQAKRRYSVRPEGVTSLAETLRWPKWTDHRRQKTNASPHYRENRIGSSKRSRGGTTIPILLRPEDHGIGLSEAGGLTGARSFSQQLAIQQV